ncbi:DNA/RNA helicase domain-containing protein [Fictibacillus sp. KU28468]|uniref:DNA/RNA helicase domain-containing protein n=1 Tax=Fictibacillus sp. KU28468 TaxID=2991053 RepID=UPI00223D8A99|nr:DNA/RNA helicase domain-containing protein [Fictibacillus sp. KU28468]UZJ78757.1 DUF2075 domain-containing protein [Fictibacillus sp. KU28468]
MHLFCGQVKSLYGLSPEEINCLMIEGVNQNKLNLEEFNKQEKKSWGISIHKLVQQIKEANLDEISIILEYFVPGNMLRLDVVLVGYTHKSQMRIMIVELKEWGSIKDSPDAHHVDIGVKDQPIRQHPAAQVHQYLKSLKCYHSVLQNNPALIKLNSMSYLPNFVLKNKLFEAPHEIYKRNYMKSCFTKEDTQALQLFLSQSFVNQAVTSDNLQLFTQGTYSLSKASLAGITKAMKGEQFVALLKEQRDVKLDATRLIDQAFSHNKKLVLVIHGDAGTGKTILGLDIIRHYIEEYPKSFFGTIPQTLRAIIDGVNKDYAAEHGLAEPAQLPTVNAILKFKETGQIVVIDEAHRLTDPKHALANLYTRFQIIILLQDDNQRIKITEQGTLDNITKCLGCNPPTLTLQTQQRAKNSGTFMKNLDLFLKGTNPGKVDLKNYELRILDSLDDIHHLLKKKISSDFKAKWLAPFCWKWNGKVNDISITDKDGQVFEKAWNPNVNKQYEWYMQKYAGHLEQVGCIYTAQGLEFDYVGLIFWDDLYYDTQNKQWKVTMKDNYDNTFVGKVVETFGGSFISKNKKVFYNGQPYSIDEFLTEINATELVLELIRNIYRVLLSRAKKGMYIWFKHEETEKYFRKHFGL